MGGEYTRALIPGERSLWPHYVTIVLKPKSSLMEELSFSIPTHGVEGTQLREALMPGSLKPGVVWGSG